MPSHQTSDIRDVVTQRQRTMRVGNYVLDKLSGEVLGEYTTHPIPEVPYDYPTARNCNLPPKSVICLLTPCEHSPYKQTIGNLTEIKVKRGPKPKTMLNPYAKHFKVANSENHPWLDDYVYGSCMTAGGVSNGTMSTSPSHVLKACMLPEVTTENIKASILLENLTPMSDRQARRVCQCARYAISGMSFFLERNPSIKGLLEFEVSFAESYPSLPRL
ncbi:hypothetical protein BV330_05516 [Pseudomonas syringae pv. actinidiae]|nr:hypothetical protein BV339_05499 [Pseudomonas syringae pv. actinidiae]OSN42726.1 hypothetical protein BV345_05384 [Pseudomonas syringae pv. actinidiae]OSN44028.1 hypothetical protein BV346_05406 [Pseudomonas syringae pv. actinidiae]OSR48021.1 hypothetical protein BV325_05664 [Pseudomonas syringae pv. actinidiae]OSR65199.1 hypothetical protein BV328_05642 [Pseudomonas syringae pv. actinidiae]